MKKIKNALKRWKSKHWDLEFFCESYENFSHAGFKRPPLRRAWDMHGPKIIKLGSWACVTIGGAILLAVIGLQ